MSESLSVGKVAGVSFDQVSTAFAKVTKAGMSTSEAGTGIKSIFEEMIDTGSKVSEILQNKTGKSFTELMNEGKTLTDVLSIIQEEADSTGVSFTELWSSENAGITGLQLLSTEGGNFNDILNQIADSSGSLDSAFGKMSDTTAFKFSSAINELKNSLIEIGSAFAPVIQGISKGISGFAKVIDSLPSGLKSIIGVILGIGSALSPLALGIAKVIKSVAGLGVLDKVFNEGKAIASYRAEIDALVKGGAELASTYGKSTGIFKALFSIIKAHPFLAIATAIAIATAAIIKWKNANKEAIEEGKQRISSLKDEIKTDKEKAEAFKSIAKEYDTLSRKQNKSAEEQKRYLELTKQIAELYPELVKGVDANGDPILDLNANAETYCNTLDRAIEKKEKVLAQEENDQADRYKKELDKITKAQEEYQKNKKIKDNGQGFDYIRKREEENYKKGLKAYQDYEEAKESIAEQALNRLQEKTAYKNSNSTQKEDISSLYRGLDFAWLEKQQGSGAVDGFIKDYGKIKKVMIETGDISEEQAKKISKAQESYGNTGNLDKYTDSMVKQYQAMEGFDSSSLNAWFSNVEDYVSRTGDLEGANAQVAKMCDYLAQVTGIDSSIWADLFHINVEPLTVADEKLKGFLENYNTNLNNLGKGGLADKMEGEFNNLISARDRLEKEFADKEIDCETLVNMTVDTPTPIQELVSQIVSDEEVTPEEYDLLVEVSTEIENEGEISEETKAKIKELYPDMTDEEIEARFTVKADVQNEQEVEDILKTFKGISLETKAEIRAVVNNKEEAQELYNLIKDVPEEKRIEIINDFASAKEEARQLGIAMDELPLDKKMQIRK